MQPEDRVRLQHMIEAGDAIARLIAKRTRAELDANEMLSLALARAIEIIGEAASRLTPATRSAVPEIPWGRIVAMRNRLAHAYFDIDRDVLWKTAEEDVPSLLPALRALVAPG